MKMLLPLLLSLSLSAVPLETPVHQPGLFELLDPKPATVDLSAIRFLVCHSDKGDWVGSGFLIGDKQLATALHVAKGAKCVDAETGGQLLMYREDDKHDLALMTGPTLPTDIPYIKVSCSRFVTGKPYLSYGVTFYGTTRPIARMNTIYATDEYTPKDFMVDETPSPGMRVLMQHIAPGMSGGPVVDLDGYAHAVNNAGNSELTALYEFADGMLCK